MDQPSKKERKMRGNKHMILLFPLFFRTFLESGPRSNPY